MILSNKIKATDAVIKGIGRNRSTIIPMGTGGSHKAYLTAKIFDSLESPLMVILADQKQALSFMEDLSFFLPEELAKFRKPEEKKEVIYFPGYNILPFKSLSYHRETSSLRLAALSKILESGSQKYLVITYIDTLMQQLIPKKSINDFLELIIANEEIDRDQLIIKLEEGGYSRVSLVEDPGEYSVRGGILDLFSPGETKPVRIEFFGDLVESIRYFSPFTQRTTKELNETIILPATEAIILRDQLPHILARLRDAGTKAGLPADHTRAYVNETRESGRFPGIESMLSIVYDSLDSLFEYLPGSTVFLLDSPDTLAAKAEEFENRALHNYKTVTEENRLCVNPESIYLKYGQVMEHINEHKQVAFKQIILEEDKENSAVISFDYGDNLELSAVLRRQGQQDHQGRQDHQEQQEHQEHKDQPVEEADENPLKPLVKWFEEQLGLQRVVFCIMNQDIQAKRLTSLLAPYGIRPGPIESFGQGKNLSSGVYYIIADLSAGFVLPGENIAIVTENEIFGKKRIRRQKSRHRDLKTEFIAPEELKNGDIVVHMEHGVGQYDGLCNLNIAGISQDFILIIYQDDDKLYLPVDRIEMIGKYIGVDGYRIIIIMILKLLFPMKKPGINSRPLMMSTWIWNQRPPWTALCVGMWDMERLKLQ